jgi:hypothetical protein
MCSPRSPLQPCNHDDVYPVEFRGRTYIPGSYNTFASQLRSHPLSEEHWAATTVPTKPQQRPSGRYSTQFPSSWLLQAQNGADSVVYFNDRPATGVESPRTSTHLSSVTPPLTASIPTSTLWAELPIRTSMHACGDHVMTGTQDSLFAEADASPEVRMRDDIMSELEEEPTYLNKEEEIGIWVQSLDPTAQLSASGNIPSSTNNRLGSLREKHPSGFDEADMSDVSGLGDVPHMTQEVPDTYSIYSTSTCLRDEVL